SVIDWRRTNLQQEMEKGPAGYQVTPDVTCFRTISANVCFIGEQGVPSGEWVLVDAGIPYSAPMILKAAKQRYGEGSRPKAIVLTHGHFDHVGALAELVQAWDVPVYAHEGELPHLTGKEAYPPPDPSVGGGLMSYISPIFPRGAIDLGERVIALPADGSIPPLPEWRWIHTPGHTDGHISLFRDLDALLISGDAFITVKQESAFDVLAQKKEIHGPPAYFTTDWERAWESVKQLEALRPSAVVAGHGKPMVGEELALQLEVLASHFDRLAIPERGRYVHPRARI
ncbi:MBL fold metallo-hydrolase, partial [Microbacteriaceae bacterium K1510]|nr:MBL fold metallo-hydrolase [Microbacteriaceae bacterium K1510]